MKAIVGLGNPGSQYEGTRHNLGFMVARHLAESLEAKFSASHCCRGLEAGLKIDGEDTKLLLPLTFMNLSGRAVKPFMAHYELAADNLLVVYDDFDLNFGQLRLRSKGSAGGHNGLTSIIDSLGRDDFPRLRLGIGQPQQKNDSTDFVLSGFSSEEKKELDSFIEHATACCRAWVTEEIDVVMSQFNKRKEDGQV
ncbi:MAG: aminoacyl-tRNA hydrolase [Candidatus Omnitrophota bacterium]